MKPKRQKADAIREPTLFEMDKLKQATGLVNKLSVARPYSEPGLLLGTSAFTANGWSGSFYPAGMELRRERPLTSNSACVCRMCA